LNESNQNTARVVNSPLNSLRTHLLTLRHIQIFTFFYFSAIRALVLEHFEESMWRFLPLLQGLLEYKRVYTFGYWLILYLNGILFTIVYWRWLEKFSQLNFLTIDCFLHLPLSLLPAFSTSRSLYFLLYLPPASCSLMPC
jgi:hypothetical protein